MWVVPPLFTVLLVVVPRLVDADEVPRSSDEYITAVSERGPQILDRDGVPGASVSVVADGELVWAEGFGTRDRETGDPVVPDTVFEAGCNAQPVACPSAWMPPGIP